VQGRQDACPTGAICFLSAFSVSKYQYKSAKSSGFSHVGWDESSSRTGHVVGLEDSSHPTSGFNAFK
jgi:hypothetical protein